MLVCGLTSYPTPSAAGTLSGSYSPIADGSLINLSAEGPADWVHWGLLTNTGTVLNRKALVPPQISDYTLVYSNGLVYDISAFSYEDNLFGYSWSDGAPTLAATNTTSGLYAYSSTSPESTGFQLTVPADPRARSLKLYVGAFSGQGQLLAELSDGSAPGYLDNTLLAKTGTSTNRVYTLTFSADAPGQSLRVRWWLAAQNGGTVKVPNVTLQAAALSTPGIDIPPSVSLVTPTNTAQFALGQPISCLAAATDVDGSVTNVSFFANGREIGQATNAPFAWCWSGATAGIHRISAVATDSAGSCWASTTNEIFVYRPGGYLTGTCATSPPGNSVDLTAEGTLDWLHWGLSAPDSLDRKSGVSALLGNFTQLGTNALERLADSANQWSWSDGTPTLSNPGSLTGIFVEGGANGFDLALPAAASPQRLRLYAGLYGSQSWLRVWLSDYSAPAFYARLETDAYHTQDGCFEIHFAAAPGRQLLLHYQNQALYDVIYGNTRLMSATLQPDDSVGLPLQLLSPTVQGAALVFSLNTVSNHLYTLEGTETLPALTWSNLGSFYGTGGLLTVTNPASIPGAYFYRMRTQ